MVDPGINNFITAENVLNNGASKIIIGTETMKNFGFIEQISKKIPVDKIIISIDMKNKKLLSRSRIIKLMSPMKFIKEVNDIGIKKIILLELTKVGSQEGVDIDFLDKVNDKLDIIVGGGIKNIKDIENLDEMGIYGVLIATSLHNGNITRKELRSWIGNS